MVNNQIHIIMPVKDSIELTLKSITAILQAGYTLTVYNDNSSSENTRILYEWSSKWNFTLVDICDITTHPSPNYLTILQLAQKHAIQQKQHLVIIESDVVIGNQTIQQMVDQVESGVGMVAAITVDEEGNINFPYQYARRWKKTVHETNKRFSFCCTLLTNEYLNLYSFELLDPDKNWYDVFISHRSIDLGLKNRLMVNNSVTHYPHSSRPWKLLKYTHPLRYYWRKITQKIDKI